MELETLRLFLEVLHTRNFSEVARKRGIAPSSVSRAITGLEEELGVRLVQRTTRSVTPTEAGETFGERVRTILLKLEEARLETSDLNDEPRGTLRVTATGTFAELHIFPFIPEFMELFPDLKLEFISSPELLNLVNRRIDVGIRIGKPADSTLIARKLCAHDRCLCASPTYLEKHAAPMTPAAVADHNALRYPYDGHPFRWRFRKWGEEEIVDVPIDGNLTMDHGEGLRRAALDGMGLACFPKWLIADDLRSGSLVELMPEWDVTPTEFEAGIYFTYPSREYLPRKVRAFYEFLKEKYAPAPPWESAA